MFLHDTIDSMQNLMKNAKNDQPGHEYRAALKEILVSMPHAKAFHFGQRADIDRLFLDKKKIGLFDMGLFMGNLAIDVNLPFDNCWFDYSDPRDLSPGDNGLKSSKRGVYLRRLRNNAGRYEFSVNIFIQVDNVKNWLMSPIQYTIVVGQKVEAKNPFFQDEKGMTNIISKNIDNKAILKNITDYNQLLREDANEITFVNFALMLLNSRNIGTKTIMPPERLNKKRIKKGKTPLFTYRTLVLKPVGKRQESSARVGLWDNRVHFALGHFKTFTPEKPLFGKHVGRFWWNQQVRGSKEKGAVMKDYEVDVRQIAHNMA